MCLTYLYYVGEHDFISSSHCEYVWWLVGAMRACKVGVRLCVCLEWFNLIWLIMANLEPLLNFEKWPNISIFKTEINQPNVQSFWDISVFEKKLNSHFGQKGLEKSTWSIFLSESLKKDLTIYSYFHKKTQHEFWEAFFQRNTSESLKPIKDKFFFKLSYI
jgi:hypothetical protein